MNLRKLKSGYYKYKTAEESLAAVKQNWYALRYVKEQTGGICLAAVQQDGLALQYVRNQTEEICLAAVQQDGYALQYVNENCLPGARFITVNDKKIETSEESYQTLKESLTD